MRAMVVVVLALSATNLRADDFIGFYTGLGLGPARLNGRGVETDDTAYKVFAGYTFGASDDELLSIELAYMDGGSTKEVGNLLDWTNPAMMRTLGISREVETRAANLSIVGMKPLTRWFGVFAKVGYVYADFDITSMQERRDGGMVRNTFDVSSNDLSYGGGFSFSFNNAFMVRAEYEGFELERRGRLQLISLSGIYRFR